MRLNTSDSSLPNNLICGSKCLFILKISLSSGTRHQDAALPIRVILNQANGWAYKLTDSSLRRELSDSAVRSELECEIKLQKLSSDDIRDISDKIKHLSLNEQILDEVSSDRIYGHSDMNEDFIVAEIWRVPLI